MVWGVTSAGFVKKTFNDVYGSIKDAVHATPGMSRVNLERDSFLGNVVAVAAAAIAEAWDALQEVYSSLDPDSATKRSLDIICKYTGTKRRGASYSLATCSVNVDPGVYAAGALTASVAGTPASRFVNLDTVTNSGGSAATITGVRFRCEATGPVRAPSGSLTVIASPVSGWNSVTNPLDAVVGKDIETDAELRQRREEELSVNGASTFDAMTADILADGRVVHARVFQNDTDATVGSLPPHSFECVIYDGTTDGSAISDADCAALVWKCKPSGIRDVGTSSAYTPGADGLNHLVHFTRPTVVPIYATFAVVQNSADGVVNPLVDLRDAVLAFARDKYNVGTDVVWSSLFRPAFVRGIYDITDLFIGTAPSPSGTANIVIDDHSIAVFDSSRIMVT